MISAQPSTRTKSMILNGKEMMMGDSILRVTLEGEVSADSVTDEVMKLLTQDAVKHEP